MPVVDEIDGTIRCGIWHHLDPDRSADPIRRNRDRARIDPDTGPFAFDDRTARIPQHTQMPEAESAKADFVLS